ncbi:MAG: hypothetical protein ACTHJT_13635 [Cytophaga sp.]|uniref:hypothetical protein n=1 Tax=Cytophaga sp. TaxID=29535 RepID=UPI003F7DD18F
MMKHIVMLAVLALATAACSNDKLEEKGFQVSASPESGGEDEEQADGWHKDSLKFDTRPSHVLLTGVPNVRLATIYKVNVNKRNNSTFIGSNGFHYKYEETEDPHNSWHGNLMPGLEGVYGYNMVNVSHYDIKENKQHNLFEKPVLIKSVYYPSFSKDTLNDKPVQRNYFIVSVYNDDTNKDGFINLKDLRRLYLFDLNGEKQKALVPENYSVYKSEYDSANDLMYIFARLDANNNGRVDVNEPANIFWVDLKDPMKTGQQY